jgi:protein-S-isoprenylcysteine O-methyltransferase Ste14
MIVLLGTIIMGWNTKSTVYLIVWIYFLLHVIFNHFAILYEEEKDVQKFGQEYEEYVKRVPRYFLLK